MGVWRVVDDRLFEGKHRPGSMAADAALLKEQRRMRSSIR